MRYLRIAILPALIGATACQAESEDLTDIIPQFETTGHGLPSNGLPSNGLPSNGLPSNGLPSNGLPSNGLAATSFNTASFSNWFHWFQGCGTADGCDPANPSSGSTGSGTAQSRALADTIMKYIVRCACPASATLSYTDRAGSAHSWTGMLGMAPNWCSATTPQAASVADQEWVTACLLGMVNRRAGNLPSGISAIQISMSTSSAEQPQLKVLDSSAEKFTYYANNSDVNGTYGNIFGDPNQGQKGAYGLIGAPDPLWVKHNYLQELGRDCHVDGCGVFTPGTACVSSNCYSTAGNWPDVHGHNPQFPYKCVYGAAGSITFDQPTSCPDPSGRTWTRILTVADPNAGQLSNYNSGITYVANNPDSCGVKAAEVPFYLSSTSGWAGNYLNLNGFTPAAGGSFVFSFRYKSTAAAKVNIITHVSRGTTKTVLGTVSMPSTNGCYTWASFRVPYPTTNTNPVFGVGYADSTSPNVTFDAWMFSL